MSDPTDLDEKAVKKVAEGVLVQVRAVPGASQAGVRKVENGHLRVAVHASPEKGKANEEIITVLSQFFGTNKSRVAIVRGLSSRSKHVIIKELDYENALKKIDALLT
jgi:uncharacterized protein